MREVKGDSRKCLETLRVHAVTTDMDAEGG